MKALFWILLSLLVGVILLLVFGFRVGPETDQLDWGPFIVGSLLVGSASHILMNFFGFKPTKHIAQFILPEKTYARLYDKRKLQEMNRSSREFIVSAAVE